MKKILFLATLVILFTACSNDDNNNNNEPFTPQEMEFETISFGNTYDFSLPQIPPQETIIQSQEELEIFAGQPITEGPLSNFDFENYQMVIIFGDVSGHFDYYEMNNIIEYENDITLQYTHYHNIEGGSFNIYYQPWIYVKIPKSDKPVTFEVEIIEYEF